MGAGEGNGFGGDAGVVWRDEGRRGVVVLEQRQQGIGRRGAAGHPRQVVEEAAAVEGQVGVVVVEIDDFLGDARLGAVAAAERLWLSWRGHRRLSLLDRFAGRSEEHTSELQSLMRISYAVFCLKKTKQT